MSRSKPSDELARKLFDATMDRIEGQPLPDELLDLILRENPHLTRDIVLAVAPGSTCSNWVNR